MSLIVEEVPDLRKHNGRAFSSELGLKRGSEFETALFGQITTYLVTFLNPSMFLTWSQ